MVENQESLATDNKALNMEILQLKEENQALKSENNILKSNADAKRKELALSENSMLTHQSVIAKALESIQSRQMKTEERNEVLIQTLADLQRKHNF